ncbi:hypothetical protein GCM10010218_39090 [Streptomyces mashuensis]|uniref:Uncharacterized protein n=1 Tax=Streptomyces mashuensis TaxID=33904 RepID=A0A919B552_9ACTN|nr:hypothetical protein GCM10010218_39090 [Streptomyces mashuensis]
MRTSDVPVTPVRVAMPSVNPPGPAGTMAENPGRIRERPAEPTPAGGDALGALLAGTRAQGAFLLRSVFDRRGRSACRTRRR